MPTYSSFFGQEDIPNIEYFSLDHEQAEYALRAAVDLAEYEVTLMPIDTPADALETAIERAAHLEAAGNAKAREMGAIILMMSTHRDSTPQEFAEKLYKERSSQLFMRVRMPHSSSVYELLREYYDSKLGPDPLDR